MTMKAADQFGAERMGITPRSRKLAGSRKTGASSETFAVFRRGHTEVPFERAAKRVAALIADRSPESLNRDVPLGKPPACRVKAETLHEAGRRRTKHVFEAPCEMPRSAVHPFGQRFNGEITCDVFDHPGGDLAKLARGAALEMKGRRILHLAAGALQVHDKLSGYGECGCAPEIFLDKRERKIDSGGDSRRRIQASGFYEDGVRVQADTRPPRSHVVGVTPVRRCTTPVQESTFCQRIDSRADRSDAPDSRLVRAQPFRDRPSKQWILAKPTPPGITTVSIGKVASSDRSTIIRAPDSVPNAPRLRPTTIVSYGVRPDTSAFAAAKTSSGPVRSSACAASNPTTAIRRVRRTSEPPDFHTAGGIIENHTTEAFENC